MEKHILSKSTFIRGTQCLKSLYLNKKRPFLRDRLSDAQRAVFKRGTDVGVLAQQLFPDGIDLKPRSPALYRKKVTETMDIIQNNSHSTLYEATFQYDQLLVLLDILVKSPNGWTAYEVKSSLKISETFLLDAAFQYYVITHSGVQLEDFFLVYMNKAYVLGNKINLDQLFVKQSVLKEVRARQPFIEEQIEKEKEALKATSSPKIAIGTHCHHPYPCDFLRHCWKNVADNSLLYLDAFDITERFERYYAGEDQPENIPGTGLNSLQKIQVESARKKTVVKDKTKIEAFTANHLQNPVLLSMFFVRPAIPFVEGTRPYQLLPVAALIGNLSGDRSDIIFFIDDRNPGKAFEAFLQKLLADSSEIVVYDTSEVLEFIDQSLSKDRWEKVENKISGFKTLFSDGALFHYLFRGDYSPEQVARVILNRPKSGLDPSLLGMAWQRKLYEHSNDFMELKKETEDFLYRMEKFNLELVKYLKDNL